MNPEVDLTLCLFILKKLNSLQELQLGDVILQFFAQHKDESTRHSLFKAVFTRCCDSEQKVSVLTKVVSMAVGVQNSNLLNSAAVWMQVRNFIS